MNKTKTIIWIVTIITLISLSFILYKTFSTNKSNLEQTIEESVTDDNSFDTQEFSDGLKNPDSVITYPLKELETGISKKYIYSVDINKDGTPDRITKTFFENGNAHSYYKYSVELKLNGKYVDITPNNLQTTNGADCDLQQIQFKFKPHFQIIIISREIGDTWIEPTMAYKKIFSLDKDALIAHKEKQMRPICDVKELF